MPVRCPVKEMNPERKRKPAEIQEIIEQQAEYISRTQLPSGAIPWFQDGIADPWDHIECAIALDLCGRHEQAKNAYRWLGNIQNHDGSWWFSYRNNMPADYTRDANYSSYLAIGLWYHYLLTGDVDFVGQMWPALERGIGFTLGMQQPTGEVYWARDIHGKADPGALLAGSSCIWQSLRCGLKLTELLGRDKPDWDDAAARLHRAMSKQPELFDCFSDGKENYAMSWYYPVLAGVIKGKEARERIGERWDDFIIGNWGCKCQVEEPWWVTVAETCELVMALGRIGEHDRAEQLLEWIFRLRDSDGCFWTGIKIPEGEIWPDGEKPTWASAAVVMALTIQLDGDDETGVRFLPQIQ